MMPDSIQALYAESTAILTRAVAAGLMTGGGVRYEMNAERINEACTAWNEHVAARKVADKARAAYCREEGRQYWTRRGIAVGTTVYMEGYNCLGWVTRLRGVAKIGKHGAYVKVENQKGHKHPDQFQVVEGERHALAAVSA